MSYQFEATQDFFDSVEEITTLIRLSKEDSENESLFLKLSIVSLVTKFQVFVENVLEEYLYMLKNSKIRSGNLSTHMKMNSLKLSISEKNAFIGLQSHKNFTEDKRTSIKSYLNSIKYFTNDDVEIDDSFKFKTKFPMGKTGKNELLELLWQLDGDDDPFNESCGIDIEKLDSLLQSRHLIVHQDRFNGTYISVEMDLDFCKKLVTYMDSYLDISFLNA